MQQFHAVLAGLLLAVLPLFSLQAAYAPAGMDIESRVYTRDATGNVTGRTDTNDAVQYGYDALHRLLQESGGPHTDAYSWDANGNRESFTRDGQVTDYVTDPSSNRLEQVGSTSRTHDAAGHTLSDGTRSYTWNDAGRLSEVYENGQLLASYSYDARGRRANKTTAGGTTYFIYDQGGQLVGEYDQNGQALKEYVHLNGEPIAQLESQQVTYLHADHLGTPRRATDSTGEVVWRWDSEAFGSEAADEDPDQDGQVTTVNLRFPGQYYDQETGLHYNYYRYYDPETGRYITSDPIGLLGSLNTYAYVGGKPTAFIDPLGLYDIFIGGFGDSFSGIVRNYRGDFAQEFSDRKTDYFGWGDSAGILQAIRSTRRDNPCEPINLIGHSWGGDTAADVAATLNSEGVGVDKLITIDPVSWPWSRSEVVKNVSQWINVSAAPSTSNGFEGDAWAQIGGKWNSGYSAPFHHNEFGSMMDWTPPGGQSPRNALLKSNSGCTCQ